MQKQKREPAFNALVGIGLKCWFVLLFALLFTSGCIGPYSECIAGSGNVVAEDFTVDEFHSVSFGGAGNLYVTQGAPHALRIEAEDNILELLTVKVVNGKLDIGSTRCYTNTKPVNVYVTQEEVRELAGSGSVNIIAQTELTADALEASISGSGNLDLTVEDFDKRHF
jgi:hypothetical protein